MQELSVVFSVTTIPAGVRHLCASQNVRVPRHKHAGIEEIVIISGKLRIGGVEMEEGDYLFTSAGEEHDVVAITDAVIFVFSEKATPVVV